MTALELQRAAAPRILPTLNQSLSFPVCFEDYPVSLVVLPCRAVLAGLTPRSEHFRPRFLPFDRPDCYAGLQGRCKSRGCETRVPCSLLLPQSTYQPFPFFASLLQRLRHGNRTSLAAL